MNGGATPGRKRRLSNFFQAALRAAIFRIDWVLRRCYGVREFSTGRDDLLRVSLGRARHDIVLPDGSCIAAGDAILDVHLWNERVQGLGRSDSMIARAGRLRRRIDHSLRRLAALVRADPSLRSCKAVRAETVFAAGEEAEAAIKVAARFGFTLEESRPASLGETLVGLGLAWASNPEGLRGKPFRRARKELWLSRAALLARYPASEAAGDAAPGEPRR